MMYSNEPYNKIDSTWNGAIYGALLGGATAYGVGAALGARALRMHGGGDLQAGVDNYVTNMNRYLSRYQGMTGNDAGFLASQRAEAYANKKLYDPLSKSNNKLDKLSSALYNTGNRRWTALGAIAAGSLLGEVIDSRN